MRIREHLFKAAVHFSFIFLAASLASAETAPSGYSKRPSSLYRDIFDQDVYYEGTQYLHLERLYRKIFHLKSRALDVNTFDEVPDSTFFTNRHGKTPLSLDELKRGPAVTPGPDPGGKWLITKGKFEGLTPGFFIKDSRGDRYLLKFDPMDYLELATGAEIIASRFLHAIGYHVPQYTVVYFEKDQFEIAPSAKAYDSKTGFSKPLTPQRLEDFLLFTPRTDDGRHRVSASRLLEGEILGPMSLQGRRKEDPDDPVDHKDRREIRALQVFSAWLNNYDVRESNTLDVVEEEGGRKIIRHYFIDFNSSLGARPSEPKPPVFGHEHIVDYGEITKALLSLGFWKKPWQKRWDEAGRTVPYPRAGYFDNRYFDPPRYKTQLPYFPFKDLTRADGFWAAKILMKFTDQEIAEIVSTGDFSDKKEEDYLTQTLIERRDLMGRYWFKQVNPLDDFRLVQQSDGSFELTFEDLAVHYGFESAGSSLYRVDGIGRKGRKGIRLAKEETHERRFSIRPEWLTLHSSIDLLIRTKGQASNEWSPFVRVTIQSDGNKAHLTEILHPD